jgi:hypothetical protein
MTPQEYAQARARGYTDEEIAAKGWEIPVQPKAESKALWGVPGARYLKPGERAIDIPGPLSVMGGNIKKNWPEILAGSAASLVPGGKVLGPLARMGTAGAITGAGRGLQGHDPLAAAATGALGQAGGEALMGVPQVLGQGVLRSKFTNETMQKLGAYLQDNIPAWTTFKANTKGVRDMFFSQRGQNALHRAYDDALKEIIEKGSQKDIVVPQSVAINLGIPVKGMVSPAVNPTGAGPMGEATVAVNAADAAKAALGRWKNQPGAYRYINKALDDADVGNPAARKAYKIGMGTKEFFEKSGAWDGNNIQIEKAQRALTQPASKALLRRDMADEVGNILLPPGSEPITKGTYQTQGTIGGTLLGGMTGALAGPLGHSGIPVGAGGGAWLGRTIGHALPRYQHVPVPEGVEGAKKALGSMFGGIGASSVLPPVTLAPPEPKE